MKLKLIIFSLLVFAFTACNKSFLDRKPSSNILLDEQLQEIGASSPSSLIKVVDPSIKGIYAYMRTFATWSSNHDDFGQKAVDLGLDLMTEDVVQSVDHWFGFDYLLDNRQATYRRTIFMWNFYYKIIYNANLIIGQIDPATTDADLKYIRGQSLAMRGYAYFYLVQLYQNTYKGHESALGVPIYTETSLEGHARAPVSEVYDRIVADLTEAVDILNGFTRGTPDQVDQHVAEGMLARVYLSMERWADAATMAHQARTGFPLMGNADYQAGFSSVGNPEWMWGTDITSETTTIYASFFSMMDNTSPGYAGALGVYKLISKKLYDQIPATDIRKTVFNDPGTTIDPDLPPYAQLKFIDPSGAFTGDYLYMRASEMYLIEAEALARQTQDDMAADVLFELVSKRDPAYVKSSNTGQALIDEIILQKRIELWGEGITFLDMKRLKEGLDRTGSNHRPDAVLVFPPEDKVFTYKLPQRELDNNPNIPASDQNP